MRDGDGVSDVISHLCEMKPSPLVSKLLRSLSSPSPDHMEQLFRYCFSSSKISDVECSAVSSKSDDLMETGPKSRDSTDIPVALKSEGSYVVDDGGLEASRPFRLDTVSHLLLSPNVQYQNQMMEFCLKACPGMVAIQSVLHSLLISSFVHPDDANMCLDVLHHIRHVLSRNPATCVQVVRLIVAEMKAANSKGFPDSRKQLLCFLFKDSLGKYWIVCVCVAWQWIHAYSICVRSYIAFQYCRCRGISKRFF